MAIDKAIDSTQLDADLASIANAIRTKGGTSAQLAFPIGFVQAIGNIQTGGGGVEMESGTFTLSGNIQNKTVSVSFNPTHFILYATGGRSAFAASTKRVSAMALFDRSTGWGVRLSTSSNTADAYVTLSATNLAYADGVLTIDTGSSSYLLGTGKTYKWYAWR